MDVQMADVQCNLQHPNERVAYPTALQEVSIASMKAETEQPMQIDMATPRADEVEPQGNRIPLLRSDGPKSSCWS